MIRMGSSRVKNGIIIGIESIKLAWRNPVIWLYAIIPTLIALICHLYSVSKPLKIIISVFTVIIFACGLARYTMHILRQQTASLHESYRWILHHYKPILFLLLVDLTWMLSVLLPAYYWGDAPPTTLISAVIILMWFVLMPGLMYISLLVIPLAIPIIATEKISFLHAFKRSLHLTWHNFITCITRFIFLMLICKLAKQLLFWSTGIPSDAWSVALFPLFTISNTIFYYEFYVKYGKPAVHHEPKEF